MLLGYKCFTLLSWELGWGVYADAQNINKIIQILLGQNKLQQDQILELSPFITLQ